MSLNANCPYCKEDVLGRLLPRAYELLHTNDDGPPSTIALKCRNCKQEVTFALWWETRLSQIIPLEGP